MKKVVQKIVDGLNRKDGFEIGVLCCLAKRRREIEETMGVKLHRASSPGSFWDANFY